MTDVLRCVKMDKIQKIGSFMKKDLIQKIQSLKEEKNAVILAHYYADEDVQGVADYIGDSFYLAKLAKSIEKDVIVFCGVAFMGESAKILNPKKTVLLPDTTADCPMAHMVKAGKIEEMRANYPDLAVVCYVNSDVELKCKSDVCVTSSNAVKIVKALPNKNIFFIPDENLGRYVKEQVPEKNVILNDGFCPRHVNIKREHLELAKSRHPNALVLAHPECTADVLALADYIGSTAEIIDYAKKSEKTEFIICTEQGVIYKLMEDNPEKRFYFTSPCPICPDMKKNTLEKIVRVLEKNENQVEVDEEVAKKAVLCLDKMLELAK